VNLDDFEPQFTARTERDHRLICARGEIDMAVAHEFQQQVEAATEPTVVIDLTDVTYVDSAGIRAIDRSAAALAERHQQVRLVVPPTSPVDWTFKVAGFDPNHLFPSVDTALD
jgi:anti-sigma B factor antagonist